MRAPQIIYIAMLAAGAGIAMVKHGKPKEGNYNFWTSLLSSAIVVGLLIWGGFFS